MSNDGSTSINAIDVAVGLAFGAGTQPTLQMLAPLITNNHYHNNIVYTYIYYNNTITIYTAALVDKMENNKTLKY